MIFIIWKKIYLGSLFFPLTAALPILHRSPHSPVRWPRSGPCEGWGFSRQAYPCPCLANTKALLVRGSVDDWALALAGWVAHMRSTATCSGTSIPGCRLLWGVPRSVVRSSCLFLFYEFLPVLLMLFWNSPALLFKLWFYNLKKNPLTSATMQDSIRELKLVWHYTKTPPHFAQSLSIFYAISTIWKNQKLVIVSGPNCMASITGGGVGTFAVIQPLFQTTKNMSPPPPYSLKRPPPPLPAPPPQDGRTFESPILFSNDNGISIPLTDEFFVTNANYPSLMSSVQILNMILKIENKFS